LKTPHCPRLLIAFLAALLTACGGGDGGGGGSAPITTDCTIPQQNQAVYDTMREYYLWYRDMPTVNPRSFASPDALLEALRVDPPDRFSYLTTVAEEDALFGASQFVGLGFRSFITATEVRAADVFENGPAWNAGMKRGSTILSVDGVPIAEVLASPGGFSGALGPQEVGYEVTLEFSDPAGGVFTRSIAKSVVTIPPVTGSQIFPIDGRMTGYLMFRNFVDPGRAALDAAFSGYRSFGVTQLIIDLRYNSGGLVSTLEHFANLLGSRVAPGAVFATYAHNDRQRSLDESILFASQPFDNALDLERIVFITTEATASASEMLINGMRPTGIPMATVGTATFGKPVGQYGFRFCGRVLRPVSFRLVNGLGEGDFFDGIPADCPAGDTLEVRFGEGGDSSMDAAVHWLRHGFCPGTAQAFARAEVFGGPPPRPAAERPRAWRLNDAH
jgi:carboxyl-terminal processing protease